MPVPAVAPFTKESCSDHMTDEFRQAFFWDEYGESAYMNGCCFCACDRNLRLVVLLRAVSPTGGTSPAMHHKQQNIYAAA